MTQMEKLMELSPCSEGLDFAKKHKTVMQAWRACKRGDWMLWLAKQLGADSRVLTLAKGLCANTVRHLMKDNRSVRAVEIAIAYGRGTATEMQLSDAAAYAAGAGVDAAAAAAAYAAYAAGAGADAAAAAYAAGAAAAYAAAAYADAAYADAAAREKNRKQTADICREILTDAVREALNGGNKG